MIILRLLLLLTNLHLKLLSTQGTGADKLLSTQRVKQSSAKSLTLEDTIDGRSFMCNRKSIGPKTVPCGTPESTSTRPDDTPSTTTHCLRFF